MPRGRHLRRSLFIFMTAAALLAACGGVGGSVVATVDEEPIDQAEILALRNSYAGDRVDGEAFRSDLTRVIFLRALLHAAAEDFGLTALSSTDMHEQKLANLDLPEQQVLESVSADPDLTDETFDVTVTQLVIRDEVTRALLTADRAFLEDTWVNNPELINQVCARHILVATETEAGQVKARLESGEDFASIADELSLDTSPGGELPCPTHAARYVAPFGLTSATAPLDVLTGPIETEFGWHVLVVDDRIGPATLQELLADPTRYLFPDVVTERWVAWLDEAVRRADIEVASPVGTWVPQLDGISPPE